MLVTTRCPDYPARDPPIAPHGFEARKALTAACGPLVLFLFCEIGPGADVSFHRTSQEIRIEVDLVDLYVTVNNKRGASVQGLGKENFRVSENEVEQEISHFDTDDAPYTIGLVLDHSGSMAMVIDDVFKAGLHTLQASKPVDEAFVLVFNDRVELIQDFTVDRKSLERVVHRVRAGGQTALYDATQTALNQIRRGQYRKKALLVVTDGADNSSETSYRELLDSAQQSGVIIYVVGFFGNSMRFGSLLTDSPNVEKLTRLAEVTGGRAYFPKTMKQCMQACLDIAGELRHQYRLDITPPTEKRTEPGEKSMSRFSLRALTQRRT